MNQVLFKVIRHYQSVELFFSTKIAEHLHLRLPIYSLRSFLDFIKVVQDVEIHHKLPFYGSIV